MGLEQRTAPEEADRDSEVPTIFRGPHSIPNSASHLVTPELSCTDKLNGLVLLQHQLVLGLL